MSEPFGAIYRSFSNWIFPIWFSHDHSHEWHQQWHQCPQNVNFMSTDSIRSRGSRHSANWKWCWGSSGFMTDVSERWSWKNPHGKPAWSFFFFLYIYISFVFWGGCWEVDSCIIKQDLIMTRNDEIPNFAKFDSCFIVGGWFGKQKWQKVEKLNRTVLLCLEVSW